MEEFLKTLAELKEMLEELEHNSIHKYVFVPLLNNVNYDYKEPILTLTSKNNTIKIKILGNNHITKIKVRENDGKIFINNILVLTGFAINENSLGLIRTLDPNDHVKGILVNGKILEQNLSKMEIIYPNARIMMSKLYFLMRSDVDLQNEIKITLLIDSIAESNSIKQTKYYLPYMSNQNQIEFIKIRGIADLYGINNDATNNLAKKLSDIIEYNYIIL